MNVGTGGDEGSLLDSTSLNRRRRRSCSCRYLHLTTTTTSFSDPRGVKRIEACLTRFLSTGRGRN
ncbi:hypothetical protein AKJ16_DCAP14583 [Drosera capensis]